MNASLKLLMVNLFQKSIPIRVNESKAKLISLLKSRDFDKRDETEMPGTRTLTVWRHV